MTLSDHTLGLIKAYQDLHEQVKPTYIVLDPYDAHECAMRVSAEDALVGQRFMGMEIIGVTAEHTEVGMNPIAGAGAGYRV